MKWIKNKKIILNESIFFYKTLDFFSFNFIRIKKKNISHVFFSDYFSFLISKTFYFRLSVSFLILYC